ncbi:hypothetical protein [Streptomyces mirabilis]|uniref:hypothetical protein n=1 Tax=Streptomyces mirabilis TaxID=68239 RepID=UPI0033327B41
MNKKLPKSQRKGKLPVAASQPVKGNNGLKRRRERRSDSAQPSNGDLRTYRPEELLSPPMLLTRFAERARELVAELPEDQRPAQAAIAGALRQAVLEAFRTREEYLARMVETDLLAGRPNLSAAVLGRSIRSALVDQGVRCVDFPDEQEHFVVVEGEGEAFEVLRPAYLDQATGKLILSGQLRRVPAPIDTDRSPEDKAVDTGESA